MVILEAQHAAFDANQIGTLKEGATRMRSAARRDFLLTPHEQIVRMFTTRRWRVAGYGGAATALG
jgi:hypothetical protein